VYKNTGKHQRWRAAQIGYDRNHRVKVKNLSNCHLPKERGSMSMTGRTFATSFFYPSDAKKSRNRNK
jgi:hypothetical protein